MHRHARLHQFVLAHGARAVLDRVEAHGDDGHGELRGGSGRVGPDAVDAEQLLLSDAGKTVAQEKPKETTWIIVMAVTGPVFGNTSKATM